jgi:hypothetical protein
VRRGRGRRGAANLECPARGLGSRRAGVVVELASALLELPVVLAQLGQRALELAGGRVDAEAEQGGRAAGGAGGGSGGALANPNPTGLCPGGTATCTDAEWNTSAQHLVDTLNKFKVPQAQQTRPVWMRAG